MRRLTTEQKRILTKHYKTFGTTALNMIAMIALEANNDYETLWQDAHRFLSDYQSELNYGRKTTEELKQWVRAYR